jgi:hypothetical protein
LKRKVRIILLNTMKGFLLELFIKVCCILK